METKNEENPKVENKNVEYPKKPKRGDILKKSTKVICNLKEIQFKEAIKGKHIMKYNISYEPEISNDNSLKRTILRQLKSDLSGIFEKYYLTGDTIFICTKKAKEKICLETKVGEIEYQVIFKKESNDINLSKVIDKSKENIKIKNFVENILKNIIMANNHVIKFGDSTFFDYYDIESCNFKKKCKIWNGYTTSILITERGLLLQINDKNKIITSMTAYDKIKEIASKNGNDFHTESSKREIMAFFKGRTLITQYGNYRSYKIGDIDFDRTVNSASFNMEDKDELKKLLLLKNIMKHNIKLNLNMKNNLYLLKKPKKIAKAQK